ncbi:MAG: SufD family Fe-S cluster assembly protein [Anaerolineae bacterium]|nr:SufD family Fe-S cluster assembly protein [Anaerolineae bacterium]
MKKTRSAIDNQTTNTETDLIPLNQVDETDAAALAEVGVIVDARQRSGTYIQRDHKPLCIMAQNEGLELLPIAQALEMYPWVRENYYWNLVSPNQDEITQHCAAQKVPQGFFIRVKKGVKIDKPCQASLYMAHTNITQAIHNIIILEEGAELHLITGCVSQHQVHTGLHYAVSEHYIGKHATLTSTMIHSWGPEVIVRPHAGTSVEEGGTFVNNYVSLRPAGDILSRPTTWLNGKGASAKYFTVILGSKGSEITTGGDVYLNAEGTSAEIAHRGVCTGGHLNQEGLLIGNAPCRAHVDCAGMLVDPGVDGYIESIPGLRATHPDARMSHEASIGKIAPEEVEYLQSRGIEEREAISMIIRGFLDADIEGLGPELDARIAEIAELAGHGE